MAKKDVEKYYNDIANEYIEMLESLKEIEELAAQQVVSPEKVEEIKAMVEPLKNNYMTLSWVMFLLNQPNKKQKVARYKKQQKNVILKIDPEQTRDPLAVKKENLGVLNQLDEFKAEFK